MLPAVITAFAPRFSANDNGDILFVANTVLTAPSTDADAANARNGVGTRVNNNDFSMVYLDVDGSATTFNSSQATLALPAGGTVLFAGLYWGANSTASARNQVLFGTPTSSTYASLTGILIGASSGADYQAFADVTTAVRAAGNGT